MFEKLCENQDEHMFHPHEVEVTKICEGKTICGAWSHRRHEFTVMERAHCRGICNCGLTRQAHGPGAHK
jgi:hypothetical protein